MRSLRKHSEGGTRFKTATLTGLIAGETIQPYPMNNETSILLSEDCRIGDKVLEAPPQSPRP